MSFSDSAATPIDVPTSRTIGAAGTIKTIAVVGAGVMGSAIAAHCANAGCRVILLDIVPSDADTEEGDRNRFALAALERLKKNRPPAFMSAAFADRIDIGNLDDDLAKLSDADWIIEAVVERADIKQDLFRKIDAVRRPGSIVSSNTSTIPLETMISDQSKAFASDFLITHFFNPPRYMQLLEIVVGPDTNADAAALIQAFCTTALGKSTVFCKDRPGFIANRIGTYFVLLAISEAKRIGLTVEETDAVCGRPMGMPKTGVFGLVDLVGLDVIQAVKTGLINNLPETDDLHRVADQAGLIAAMIDEGQLGRKSPKGGFYRTLKTENGKQKQSLDLNTLDYRKSPGDDFDPRAIAVISLEDLLAQTSSYGQFAKSVLVQFLTYVASLVPEVSDSVADVDKAMRLGYGWQRGPFEMIDQLGVDVLSGHIKALGLPVPDAISCTPAPFYKMTPSGLTWRGHSETYSPVGVDPDVLSLAQIKRSSKPVFSNGSAALWDLGDGVLNLEITTKQNALGQPVFDVFEHAFDLLEASNNPWRAMTVYSDQKNFAAGADLNEFYTLTSSNDWASLRTFAQRGQDVFQRMRSLNHPVVSGVSGVAVGGGCELILYSTAAVVHAETYIGLVEASVGIIPAWGGCAELLSRHSEQLPDNADQALLNAFLAILTCRTSTSAHHAKEMLVLRPTDKIVMHREHVLAEAKSAALSLVGNIPQATPTFPDLLGAEGRQGLRDEMQKRAESGRLQSHDVEVGEVLATTLTGTGFEDGDLSPKSMVLGLEIVGALKLFQTSETQQRISRLLRK